MGMDATLLPPPANADLPAAGAAAPRSRRLWVGGAALLGAAALAGTAAVHAWTQAEGPPAEANTAFSVGAVIGAPPVARSFSSSILQENWCVCVCARACRTFPSLPQFPIQN